MEDSETLHKLAILTWRNIADSAAGPCDAGGGPMTEGNFSGPRRASQSSALLSTHWSDAMHGRMEGGPPPPV